MRIGILTYHSSYNFGANLQTLATQSALGNRKVAPVVVNYQDERKMAEYQETTLTAQCQLHEEFGKKYLKLSPLLQSSKQVQEYCLDSLDGIVVGSDAVFRLIPKYDMVRNLRKWAGRIRSKITYNSDCILPVYWSNWNGGRSRTRPKKASLAASAAGTPFYFIDTKLYRQLWGAIRGFDYLTVRDEWTRFMLACLSLGTRVPDTCPDPVMVLNDYFEIPNEENVCNLGENAIFVAGNFKIELLKQLKQTANERGLLLATLPNPENAFVSDCVDVNVDLPLAPLGWYSMLKNASGYIGIRFHALVSCLANRTPIVTVDPVSRYGLMQKYRSRQYDLCRRAGIEGRYITLTELNRSVATSLVERLFDRETLASFDTYRVSARLIFDKVLDRILTVMGA